MVRLEYKNLIVLGLIPSELQHLKEGQPLNIRLESGMVVVLMPGDSNEQLNNVFATGATTLEAMARDKKAEQGGFKLPSIFGGKKH